VAVKHIKECAARGAGACGAGFHSELTPYPAGNI